MRVRCNAPHRIRGNRPLAARACRAYGSPNDLHARSKGEWPQMLELNAAEDQFNAPFIYASARDGYALRKLGDKPNGMTPLFLAAIEATEEAVYNSLLKATTVSGNGHTIEALPIEPTVAILRKHQVIR